MKNTENSDISNNSELNESIKIKVINQRVYDAFDKFGEICAGKIIDKSFNQYSSYHENYLKEFDINNNLIKETFFNEGNVIIEVITYSFVDNLVVEINCNYYIKYENSSYKETYKYNSNKKLESITKFDKNGKIKHKSIYKYNEEDMDYEVNDYEEFGVFYRKNKYCFNEDNLLETRTEFDKEGYKTNKGTYTYKNNILEQIETNQISKVGTIFETYVKGSYYDSKGNITIEYDYDKIQRYNFNKLGFMTRYTIENRKEKKLEDEITYTYEKDEIGNWIKKTHFRNEIPFAITIREIKYYNESESSNFRFYNDLHG